MIKYYHVRVQRRFLPWMSTYTVTHHFWSPDESRLTLVLLSGESLQFPRMDQRKVMIESNYRGFMEYKRFQEYAESQQRSLREAAAPQPLAPPPISRPTPPQETAPAPQQDDAPARLQFWPATPDEMQNLPQ